MDRRTIMGGGEVRPAGRDEDTGQARNPGTHGKLGGDDFRVYMATKIELQRKQFGLVLPPPPSPGDTCIVGSSPLEVSTWPRKNESTNTSSMKRVRFSPSTPSDLGKSRGLTGVLCRLKKKHGSKCTNRSGSRKRRRREANVNSNDISPPLDNSACGSCSPASWSTAKAPNDVIVSKAIPKIQEGAIKKKRQDLFLLGVVVLINGFTSPDAPTIQRMLQRHGGDVEKYETSRVTHIVATALSTAKALIYKRQRNPTPVVRPEWIVDSCKEGKVLPYAVYLLDEVRDDNVGTKTVKSFFPPSSASKKKDWVRNDATTSRCTDGNLRLESAGPETHSCNVGKEDSVDRIQEATSTNKKGMHGPPSRSHSAVGVPRSQKRTNLPSSSLIRTVGTDPEFLNSYFKNSRLSFIGSFKQRAKPSEPNVSSPRRRSRQKDERYVFHVDIDCFFAAVSLRKYPQYRDKPVAIGHGCNTDSKGSLLLSRDNPPGSIGANTKSHSELSTCNYKARDYGIRKGMFLGQARQLCPDLIVLPYDYDGYQEVSSLVSDVLRQISEEFNGAIEQVSCDESYLELFLAREAEGEKGQNYDIVKRLAEEIRSRIFASTECTASIGVGANKFIAKLATDRAKPNGSFVVQDFYNLVHSLNLRDLPGIGRKLDGKLQSHGLESVSDVLKMGDDAKGKIFSILGDVNGQKIMKYIHGEDDRPVEAVTRKTIGAECNYGVRFDGLYGPDYMVKGLCKEVEKRMASVDVLGKKVTLKIMQRKLDALEPAKFLGHGKCKNISKSDDLPTFTRDWKILFLAANKLLDEISINKEDIRGMGVVISGLDTSKESRDGGADQLSTWLKRRPAQKLHVIDKSHGAKERNINVQETHISKKRIFKESTSAAAGETSRMEGKMEYEVPTLSQIDEGVLEHLPEDIRGFVRRRLGQKNNETESILYTRRFSTEKEHGPSCDNDHGDATNEEGEIVLPPLSQIDEGEIMALPTPLRDQIFQQILFKKGDREIATSLNLNSSPNTSLIKARSPQQTNSINRLHPVSSSLGKGMKHEDHGGDTSLRQTSVKRMLKLATLKSGNGTNDSVSLTQLETLPLEVQLQVANNDEAPLQRVFVRHRGKQRNNKSSYIVDAPKELQYPFVGIQKRSPAIPNECRIPRTHTSPEVSLDGSQDFYHSNVKPLVKWMESHPDPAEDDIDRVQTFFFLLMSQKRLDNVVELLRVIRNRSDVWSKAAFQALLEAVDKHLIRTEGRKLDRFFLGLN